MAVTDEQQAFVDINSEYLEIAPMYCPILFNWPCIIYFKKYGARDFAACAADGVFVLWNDDEQHTEILAQYAEAEDNQPL